MIEELKEEKLKLQEEISQKINEFQKKYNVVVSGIEIVSNTDRTCQGELISFSPTIILKVEV